MKLLTTILVNVSPVSVFGSAAKSLTRWIREESAATGIPPAPLKRCSERMNDYGELILERMRQMGW